MGRLPIARRRNDLTANCSICFRSGDARKIWRPWRNIRDAIYGEMARCLRPCQEAVTVEEYRSESARVEQFLRTGGSSLLETAEAARDRASAEMQFEAAERLHQRVEKIIEVRGLRGSWRGASNLERPDKLNGVAVVRAPEIEAVHLLFLMGGRWLEGVRLTLGGTMGRANPWIADCAS